MASPEKLCYDMLTLPEPGLRAPAPPSTQGERIKLHINPSPRGWTVSEGAFISHFSHKTEAKRAAVRRAHQLAASGHVVSLYIAGLDGRFQEERTYPRSADPRKTPG